MAVSVSVQTLWDHLGLGKGAGQDQTVCETGLRGANCFEAVQVADFEGFTWTWQDTRTHRYVRAEDKELRENSFS